MFSLTPFKKMAPAGVMVCCFIFAAALCAHASDTEPVPSEPAEGMTYQQVLKSWGAPLEKRELETKREDVWLYSSKSVTFKEGRVIEISDTWSGDQSAALSKTAGQEPSPPPVMKPSREPEGKVVEEILTEIMKGASESSEKKPQAAEPKRPYGPSSPPSFIGGAREIPEDAAAR